MGRRKHYNFYDDQFKATAVALTKIQGVLAKDVAEALCIHPVMLYRWCMETRQQAGWAAKAFGFFGPLQKR